MKIYNYAKERKKSLTSVIKNTILDFDEAETQHGQISDGSAIKRRSASCNREDDGKGRSQSGRGSQTNWCRKEQHQQSHATQDSCESGLFDEDGGKLRSQGGNESSKTENMTRTFMTSIVSWL